jgi:hypothetical protein
MVKPLTTSGTHRTENNRRQEGKSFHEVAKGRLDPLFARYVHLRLGVCFLIFFHEISFFRPFTP